MRVKGFGKRGFDWLWNIVMVLIITLAVAILFFIILKDRVGGLLHL